MNDLPVGRSVDEVLRLVQAFKFTDEHGEGEDLFLLIVICIIYRPRLFEAWITLSTG